MEEPQTVWDVIKAYGPYSFLLIALSIIVLAMIIHFLFVRTQPGSENDPNKDRSGGESSQSDDSAR